MAASSILFWFIVIWLNALLIFKMESAKHWKPTLGILAKHKIEVYASGIKNNVVKMKKTVI